MAIRKSSAKNTGTKKKGRKAAGRKVAAKKRAKKKAVKKKPVHKKAAKKKRAAKAVRKRPVRSAAKKRTARTAATPGRIPSKLPPPVEAGPPSGSVPPVEEPARNEEAVGIVTHYYSHLGVAVVQLNKGSLRTGDTIHIVGHSSDFTQKVVSLEYEHQLVEQADAGQGVGIKVVDHAREHDIVYLVK